MKKPISCTKMLSLIGKKTEVEKKLTAIRRERRVLLKRLDDQMEQLELERRVAMDVTDNWDGVPVGVEENKTCYGLKVQVCSFCEGLRLQRDVEIYPDAHTSVDGEGKEWHIKIQVWRGYEQVYQGGRAHFFWAKSPGELLPVVRKFIVTGNVGVIEEASAKWKAMRGCEKS